MDFFIVEECIIKYIMFKSFYVLQKTQRIELTLNTLMHK